MGRMASSDASGGRAAAGGVWGGGAAGAPGRLPAFWSCLTRTAWVSSNQTDMLNACTAPPK